MYGQGYRNKAERKSNSRFVVSEKNKPGYGQKKEGGYAQNEKLKLSYGRCRKHLTKPSAFESEIHPSHKLKICTQDISPCRELFRRQADSS
jgi:hypothetical protein